MRFLTDENFNGAVFRQLKKLLPDFDIIRIQETVVFRQDDPVILEWAAQENCVVITHDVNTMTKYAYERVADGLYMPGVIEVNVSAPIGTIIVDLKYMIEVGTPDDFENKVMYVPMK
jgi:hypothetical protein